MALALTVDTLETVPEPQRALYKEVNGKFTLDVEGYEDPTGLKSALEKERQAARNASAQVKSWQALGKTPEEIQALIASQEQAERDKLTKNGEWDKLRDQMLTQHRVELSKKDEAISSARQALDKHLVDATAVSAIAAAKGSSVLLLPHIRQSVRVVEENGEFAVRVVDRLGNPRVNGKGEFLSIDDLVSEMRQSDEYGRAFDATGTTGSGSQNGGPGTSGTKTIKVQQFEALTPKERARKMSEGYTLVT